MATPILYQTSIPVLTLQLEALRAIVKKGAEWCKANNKDDTDLVLSRLAPDMNVCAMKRPFLYLVCVDLGDPYPCILQIQGCCNVWKLLTMVAPIPPPNALPASSDNPQDPIAWKFESFAELDSRLEMTLQYLQNLDAKAFEGKEGAEGELLGMVFNGLGFVQDMIPPNCTCSTLPPLIFA